MTGWTLFFMVVGITTTTAQLFRIIDFIEAPHKGRRRVRKHPSNGEA